MLQPALSSAQQSVNGDLVHLTSSSSSGGSSSQSNHRHPLSADDTPSPGSGDEDGLPYSLVDQQAAYAPAKGGARSSGFVGGGSSSSSATNRGIYARGGSVFRPARHRGYHGGDVGSGGAASGGSTWFSSSRMEARSAKRTPHQSGTIIGAPVPEGANPPHTSSGSNLYQQELHVDSGVLQAEVERVRRAARRGTGGSGMGSSLQELVVRDRPTDCMARPQAVDLSRVLPPLPTAAAACVTAHAAPAAAAASGLAVSNGCAGGDSGLSASNYEDEASTMVVASSPPQQQQQRPQAYHVDVVHERELTATIRESIVVQTMPAGMDSGRSMGSGRSSFTPHPQRGPSTPDWRWGGSDYDRNQLTGMLGEVFAYETFSAQLPGFNADCWRSHNREIAGLPKGDFDSVVDFYYMDVEGKLSGRKGMHCFIEVKSTVMETGGGHGDAFPLSEHQWQLAVNLHGRDDAVFIFARVVGVRPGGQPRLAKLIFDPVAMQLKRELKLRGSEMFVEL